MSEEERELDADENTQYVTLNPGLIPPSVDMSLWFPLKMQ
jgi:hypothetical protein